VLVLDVSKIADPSTVGLTSFAIGLLCLAANVAGLCGPAAIAVLIPLAMGVALIHFVSGTFGFIKGELFTAVAFYGYGLFWFTFALLQLGAVLKWYAPDNDIMLALYVAYTIFTFFIFIATLVTNTNVIAIIGTLLGVFVLLDLFYITGNAALVTYAGYLGIVSALCAFYFVAASVLNTMYGTTVLPMGSAWKSTSPNC
jgi:succinate-acetate transporter protein